MRLLQLVLENYIGIYNGMGMHTISIDFSKCMNAITVIKGDNGSGKSSLFKAIHPFSDAQSYLIDGVSAKKRISYILDDGSVLDIEYLYPADENSGKRKSTQCFVWYNGEDVNPNHNVTDGKTIICDLLDIDTTSLALAQLSSDDRGLADKSPSERKKFINKKIAELDAFNDIYKKISKKSSQLKGMINSLNSKIQSIGDIKNIQTNIALWENQLADLEEQKTLLIVDMSKIQANMDALYEEDTTDPKERFEQMKLTAFSIQTEMKSCKYDESITEQTKLTVSTELAKNESDLVSLEKRYTEALTNISSISTKIDDIDLKLASMGDPKLMKTYEDRIAELKRKQKEFHDLCNSHGFYRHEEISPTEYSYVLDTIHKLYSSIDIIKNTFDFSTISNTIDHLYDFKKTCSVEELDSLKDTVREKQMELSTQNVYKEQSKDFSMIPKDCPHKTDCPFIKSISSAFSKVISDEKYEELVSEIDSLKEQIITYTATMQKESDIQDCIHNIDSCMGAESSIMSSYSRELFEKFNVKQCNSKDDMIAALRSLLLGNQSNWYNLDTNYYNSIRNMFIESKSYATDISSLEKECNSLRSNQELASYLQKEKTNLSKELDTLKSIYKKAFDEYQHMSSIVQDMQKQIKLIDHNLENKGTYEDLKRKYEELNTSIQQSESDYKKYCSLNDEMNRKKKILEDLAVTQIPKITSVINEAKYKIVLYNDYVKEYSQFSSQYDKIEIIKHYCSPTSGIQTVFIDMYMNSIIDISNQLLGMLFGGEFALQPFIINDKEFRMPVLGSGIMNDDISSMSTSQICMISMIISFALLNQSSSIYNIIKMDELDGGLDTSNRLAFFNVLSALMDHLHCNQCIMISHNSELNTNNMDVIVLKNSDPTMVMDGNVIFNYDESMLD